MVKLINKDYYKAWEEKLVISCMKDHLKITSITDGVDTFLMKELIQATIKMG